MTKTPKAYAQAGVDIGLKEKLLKRLKPDLQRASRPEVVGGIGAFGGLFDFSKHAFHHPVLVSSTDSVGTKLKVATLAGQHDNVGFDIVHHCLNDIAVMGASPLFFLDYFACERLNPNIYTAVLRSVAKACQTAGCALIGGETAELPGVYREGEYDLVGAIVGAADRARLLTGAPIRAGDLIIGLASDGLHTNGYSLARRICFETLQLKPTDLLPGTRLRTGSSLLKPHRNYSPTLLSLAEWANAGKDWSKRAKNTLFGAAHITGGGLPGNLNRILPDDCDALIETASWPVPALFRTLVEAGGVSREESYEVWNMGIGLAIVTAAEAADRLLERALALGERGWIIGHIQTGRGRVLLQ